jgi:hypothetical protein
MIWKKAGSSSVTRTSVRVAGEPRGVHRRAANSAAGRRRRNCLQIAHHKPMSVRGEGLHNGQIKKSRTSALFWGLASHNMN